jgi:inhibitor of cysteine peptidase
MTLTESDNGKAFHIQIGDVIVVRLPENPATGFRWAWDEPSQDVVQIADDAYLPTGGAVGGGGYAQWTLKASRAGTACLKLKHWRQWEGEASVLNRFQVLLKVST